MRFFNFFLRTWKVIAPPALTTILSKFSGETSLISTNDRGYISETVKPAIRGNHPFNSSRHGIFGPIKVTFGLKYCAPPKKHKEFYYHYLLLMYFFSACALTLVFTYLSNLSFYLFFFNSFSFVFFCFCIDFVLVFLSTISILSIVSEYSRSS